MTTLQELKEIIEGLEIPVETAMHSDSLAQKYVVLTPIEATMIYYDDRPDMVVHSTTISLFSKENYIKTINRIISALINADYTITDSRFVEREKDSGYFHYSIDVEKTFIYAQEEI